TKNPNSAFIMQGGDMVNQGQNPKEWKAFLGRAQSVFSKIPVMPVAGNHECSAATSGKPELYTDIFHLPKNGPVGFSEEFYSFDYGDCHMVCLNSNIYLKEQLEAGTMTQGDFAKIQEWIAKDLSDSTKKWKVVMMHHPVYGVAEDSVSGDILGDWAPIFEDQGVSLVLTGHQHVNMRTYPLFDHEKNNNSGITYIMGNSGSKFYKGTATPYTEKMIENQSAYQMIHVTDESLTVKTFDKDGKELDTATIKKPVAGENAITLKSPSSVTVTAPAMAVSGASVTVELSNIPANKKVYEVSVTDKNNKTYPVKTVEANKKYSFSMANRSVIVNVLLEDISGGGSGGDGKAYTYTVNTQEDPIWTVNVASSGISGKDKISSGATVTVTVTRNDEALSASLLGIRVNGVKNHEVTTISTTHGKYGTVKGGKYQFTMPTGEITISPNVSYATLDLYARQTNSQSYELKNTLTRDKMVLYGETNGYYTAYDRLPTAVIGKAAEYVTLKKLLNKSGIALTTASSISLHSVDGATATYTYEELYGKNGYYYPNIHTGSASGKTPIEPMLVIKGYQSRFLNLPGGKTIDDMPQDTACAYRFVLGQTEEEFGNGVPSETASTAFKLKKWVDAIKVTGFKTATEEPGEIGGGTAVVETEAVTDKKGKATLVLGDENVKAGLAAALKAAKENKADPKVKINVQVDKEAKALEVVFTKNSFKSLATTENVTVTVSTPFGDLSLTPEILKAVLAGNAGKDVKMGFSFVTKGKDSMAEGRELTDAIVEITLACGDKMITEFGGEKVGITIPFTPDQKKKAKGYYAVCLTGNGKSQRMIGSSYLENEKGVHLESDHLSKFAVAYTDCTALNVFTDIKEGDWFGDCVTFVTEKGYFQGTDKHTFRPGGEMTRGMLVTVLGRAGEVNAGIYTKSSFKDVDRKSWYGNYVQWAYEQGIVKGVGNEKFAPNQPVNRQELSTILANYAVWKGGASKGVPQVQLSYTDKENLSKWAVDGVKFCTMKGWLSGYPDGSFGAHKNATRAETAKIIKGVMSSLSGV
ncbi:MAG: S-layer homology domain-containing protein, partial [Anaerovorax sp.]